jgi:SAM-dependent methyltransferase
MRETPPCPLCSDHESEERFKERGYRVFRCRTCGLFFINPYPSRDAAFRETVIDNSFEGIEFPDSAKLYRSEVYFYARYFPLIARECSGARSVLDIGCGTGRLLELLGGFPDLYRAGIELNAARADAAARRTGCAIHRVPIECFTDSRRFDVITFINVLSHIPWFDPLLRSIRSLLSDNGRFVVKTGELAPDVQKSDLLDWMIPVHVHFLGLETIEFICRLYGFRVVNHIRTPLAEELFSPETWRSPGASALRNALKRAAARTPLLLPLLKRWYEWRHGRRIYSSFIVLTPETGKQPPGGESCG